MSQRIDAWSDLRLAIKQRDIRAVCQLMFSRDGSKSSRPQVKLGCNTENELWDFKKDCPIVGKQNQPAWAELAKDVLGFHNAEGGVVIFGIDDSYRFVGARHSLDTKKLNDALRRYLGDKLWVEFHREFIQPDQSFLGTALVPPKGLRFARFVADSPNGLSRPFKKDESALRRKDSTCLVTKDELDAQEQLDPIPTVGSLYEVDTAFYRILRPDYSTFVERPDLCNSISKALKDQRVAIVSLVGIGGAGKTCLATWAVLEAYRRREFEFIVSVTAKDRELTNSGIQDLKPTLTSFDSLIAAILEVLGCEYMLSRPFEEQLGEVRKFLPGQKGLLLVDNLETVDDARVIDFLENLPEGMKAVTTSRRTRVRNLTKAIDVGGFERPELLEFMTSLRSEPRLGYLHQLTESEQFGIGKSCDMIPLVVKWTLMRSKTPSEAISNAEFLQTSGRRGGELLEYSFRRVFEEMDGSEKQLLKLLAIFQRPLPMEALLVGTDFQHSEADDAISSLCNDGLVQRQFDTDRNDYAYALPPLARSFLLRDITRSQHSTLDTMRKRLSDWYEAKDIKNEDQRGVVRRLRQGKESPEAGYLMLAHAAAKRGDTEDAKSLFDQAVSRSGANSWTARWDSAEFARVTLKNKTLALEQYSKAAQVCPRRGHERGVINREYALLLRDSGELTSTDRAIEHFKIAYEESPNDPITIYGLASTCIHV